MVTTQHTPLSILKAAAQIARNIDEGVPDMIWNFAWSTYSCICEEEEGEPEGVTIEAVEAKFDECFNAAVALGTGNKLFGLADYILALED